MNEIDINRLKWKYPNLKLYKGDEYIADIIGEEHLYDISIQIKEKSLEGYYFTDGFEICHIKPDGVFLGYFIDTPIMIQLAILAGREPEYLERAYESYKPYLNE